MERDQVQFRDTVPHAAELPMPTDFLDSMPPIPAAPARRKRRFDRVLRALGRAVAPVVAASRWIRRRRGKH
jgi:hypothetical protein